MFEVRTPVPGVTEVIAGVSFVDGRAEVGPGPALAYFRMAGYHVADLDNAVDNNEPAAAEAVEETGGSADGAPPAGAERPKGNASTDAWRAYAVARGMTAEEAANLNRDEIVARYPEENK